MFTHAGCIAFRRTVPEALFLIVSSSNAAHWVLPKGHIETGESPAEAAIRELREEAGVTGRIVAPLTTDTYQTETERVTVQYFLVEALGNVSPDDRRTVRWETEQAAMAVLSFDAAKRALRLAAGMIGPSGPERRNASP